MSGNNMGANQQALYLLGRKFMLVMDHAPLRWMSTAKDTNPQGTLWFLELQNWVTTTGVTDG